LNQREEMVREGSFRGDDFYIHQSQNAYVITDMDRKPLSPTASRLHWLTGDAREGEVRLLDGRSAAGGVNGRTDDSKPRGIVSSWVSDGTGVALVALTGRIGLMETT
jgi:hypothetical protein